MLAAAIRNDGDWVALEAADALMKTGGDLCSLLPALRAALEDQKLSARIAAARCLWRLERGDPRLFAIMRAGLGASNRHDRVHAAVGLKEMGAGAKQAVPDLLRLLRDEERVVRRFAEIALKEIDPEALNGATARVQ